MKIPSIGSVGAVVTALAGSVGLFVTTTLAMSRFPDAVVVASSCVGGAALAMASGPGLRRSRDRLLLLQASGGGVAALFAAPLMALSQRASDAPPGSEVAFFTAVAWGLILAAAAAILRRNRDLVSVVGAVVAALGAATLLASWERPSSFSPFVRFADREIWMLIAGVVFAVGVLLIVRSAESLGGKAALAVSTIAAATVGIIVAAPLVPSALPAMRMFGNVLLGVGFTGGLFTVGFLRLAASHGASSASAILLLVPAGLTGLSAVERVTSIAGPDPVIWPSAVAGIVLTLVGIMALWEPDTTPGLGVERSMSSRGLRAAAVIALALALATLLTGAMSATVSGAFNERYEASWTMLGAESAAGWLPVVLALMVLASTGALRRGSSKRARGAAIITLIGLATYPWLASVPLRTATRWIPADVQQRYGTEYARLSFEPMHEPLRILVLILVALVALIIIAVSLRQRLAPTDMEGSS